MLIYLFPMIVALTLAVYHEANVAKLGRLFYGPAVLYLSLFGGLRLEVGQDWEAYSAFFDTIDVSDNPFSFYFSSAVNLQFEFGYYLLNFVVKLLGGSYSAVLLISSVFCAFAMHRLTRRFPGNKFYILTVYIGYSFLVLHFAQVRQALAVGCFLLACDAYVASRRRVLTVVIAATAVVFQYSALLYFPALIAVLWWPARREAQVGLVLLLAAACVVPFVANPYALATMLATQSAGAKLEIYQDTQVEQGTLLIVYAAYLMLMVWYLAANQRFVEDVRQRFIIRYAIFSLLVTVLIAFAFRGSYVMYSRGYVVASIFLAYAVSLILQVRRGALHRGVFAASCLISAAYYLRILVLYSEQYTPYRSLVAATGS